MDTYFARSTDSGVTWSAPVPLQCSTVLDYHPTIACNASGYVNRFWYVESSLSLVHVRSTDAGLTWGSIVTLASGGDASAAYDPNSCLTDIF